MESCTTRNTPAPPPEQLLFALRQALDMLFEEGLDKVFLRHRLLAGKLFAALSLCGRKDWRLISILRSLGECSDTVTTVLMDNGRNPEALHEYCKTKCCVEPGQGLDK